MSNAAAALVSTDRLATILRYGSDQEPGIRRLGEPGAFRYVDARGKRVPAREVERIRKLAIPPAWTDVWIAPSDEWHLQATGRDAKGRKQYRYHEGFRAEQEAAKFDDLQQFGLDLPRLRRAVKRDLAGTALTHERVLAAVVRLLDVTHLRIGNEQYAQANGSFGLTTLRTQHVRASRRAVRLNFVGKHAHEFDVEVQDPQVATVVRRCQHLPGQLLFQYEDAEGKVHPVGSSDVNAYLQVHSCATATAKTFRTWSASVLAASHLGPIEVSSMSARERKIAVNAGIREVADELGNTLAVCRRSYVHPLVFEALESGRLGKLWDTAAPPRPTGLSADERRFMKLLAQRRKR